MKSNLKWVNWSKSVTSYPEHIVFPATEKEILALVYKAIKEQTTIKVVGAGHSCSKISATEGGYLLDLKNYNKVIDFNFSDRLLTVQSGISLKAIATFALQKNLALDNLGTIVSQSIAGAISTGTHGSGITHGAIDQSIVAFTVLTGEGKLKFFDKRLNKDEFNIAVVGLGAIGVISTVTIKLVPYYNLKVNTQSISFNTMLKNLNACYNDDYMRFWWAPHTNKVNYWIASKTDENPTKTNKFKDWYANIFLGNIFHEIGLWLTSFAPKYIPKLNRIMFNLLLEKEVKDAISDFLTAFTLPILVKQKVMEYGIPISEVPVVLKKIKKLLDDKNYKVHMPIEIRFAPKNDAALSMAYKRETCYIGIIAYKPFGKDIDYENYFKDVHTIFEAHKGRHHWAKHTFYTKEQIIDNYPDWENFVSLKNKLDPKGVFMNTFLKRLF